MQTETNFEELFREVLVSHGKMRFAIESIELNKTVPSLVREACIRTISMVSMVPNGSVAAYHIDTSRPSAVLDPSFIEWSKGEKHGR